VSTGRLEAFSDGVIAVAITLLVLDLAVPKPGANGHTLAHNLGHDWPTYAAYVVSFMTIGIIWINHHSMISRLSRGDHLILVLNLILLMTIVVIPFATNLMATYLEKSAGQHLAALVYSGSLFAMSIAFTTLNRKILLGRPELLEKPLEEAERRRIWSRAFTGVIPYVIAMAVAPFSSYATLAICGAVACFYALPVASGR
jgi:uncharacterized membrane protein